MTLLPAITFGPLWTGVGHRSGQRQTINQFGSVATIKEAKPNTWASKVQTDFAAVLIGREAVQ